VLGKGNYPNTSFIDVVCVAQDEKSRPTFSEISEKLGAIDAETEDDDTAEVAKVELANDQGTYERTPIIPVTAPPMLTNNDGIAPDGEYSSTAQHVNL
jgi:hypothetical protein